MIKEGQLMRARELLKVKILHACIFPEFCRGLQHLGDFSYVIIVYWFHERDNERERSVLKVVPRRQLGAPEVGVFASRSPSRPNPVGLCVTELMEKEGCVLTLKGLDALQNSPIIDIKPYIPRLDSIPEARVPEWTSRRPPT